MNNRVIKRMEPDAVLRIKIVQNGTVEISPEEGMTDNRPTCSLIEYEDQGVSKKLNMLIDLDHPAKESSDLVTALGKHGLSPGEIHVVLLTHLHPDHIGHKDLFSNATFIFHRDERLAFYFKNNRTRMVEGDAVLRPGAGFMPEKTATLPDLETLGDNIYMRHCPGHTKGSLVFFVRIYKYVYAFSGDIFLNKAYYDRWEPPAMSGDREAIREHMRFIGEHADVIVPGHGAPFRAA